MISQNKTLSDLSKSIESDRLELTLHKRIVTKLGSINFNLYSKRPRYNNRKMFNNDLYMYKVLKGTFIGKRYVSPIAQKSINIKNNLSRRSTMKRKISFNNIDPEVHYVSKLERGKDVIIYRRVGAYGRY